LLSSSVLDQGLPKGGALQQDSQDAQSNVNGVTRSAATPLTRSVAYAWLKERKAKQEAAIIEATVLLQGDATGDAAAASLNAAMMSCASSSAPFASR
jgi:hypothetical protein